MESIIVFSIKESNADCFKRRIQDICFVHRRRNPFIYSFLWAAVSGGAKSNLTCTMICKITRFICAYAFQDIIAGFETYTCTTSSPGRLPVFFTVSVTPSGVACRPLYSKAV